MRHGFAVAIGVACVLLWCLLLSTVNLLSASDLGRNGLGGVVAVAELIGLWLSLILLIVVGAVSSGAPAAIWGTALIVTALSGYAAYDCLGLLLAPETMPGRWPFLILSLLPIGPIGFCVWMISDRLRGMIPIWAAIPLTLGTALLLSAGAGGMVNLGQTIPTRHDAVVAKWTRDLAGLPADAPLWAWTALLRTAPDIVRQEIVLRRITNLDRRQADAETMARRGDLPLRFLNQIDLLPTAALCAGIRAELASQAAALAPQGTGARAYDDIAGPVADAAGAMEWLIGYDCPCDEESHAWEDLAHAYQGGNWDVHRLRDLRDPRHLAWRILADPDGLSFLTPASHLRLYLAFADLPALQVNALARARRLDHRDADAVVLLNDPDTAPRLLRFLPALDLDASPALCAAAARTVGDALERVPRSGGPAPSPFPDLLAALGPSRPLEALLWLAPHRCGVADLLAKARELVGPTQASPERDEMLARLKAGR